jgi:uncharacterized protein YxjI
MATAQLQPVPQPLGVFQSLMARQPQTLVVKELGDSFDVKTADGRPWMRIDAKFRTMHGRKKVYDASGHHLFDIVRANWHWHTTFDIEEEKSKKEYMQVKFKYACTLSSRVSSRVSRPKTDTPIPGMKDKVHATFNTASGTPVKLEMKGRSTLDIVDTASGALAARIERKRWNAREMLGNQQTYHLTVAPGVDTSLIVAMCICLDEKREQEQRARRR